MSTIEPDARLQQGFQTLNGESFPAGFGALRESLRNLGGSPDEVAAKLKALESTPEGARLGAFFAQLASLEGGMHQALQDLSTLVSQQQRSEVVYPEPELPNFSSWPMRQGYPIDLSKAVVAIKQTKVQFDMARYGWSYDQLLVEYAKGGEDKRRILESHEQQIANLEKVRRLFRPDQIVERTDLTADKLKDASLVIAFGGDNHFQHVAHVMDPKTPLLGVRSDIGSVGALLSCLTDELPDVLKKLAAGEFSLQGWTRLKVTVDGIESTALCDALLAENKRSPMSRHTVRTVLESGAEEEKTEQKSSGLLVATGSGSNLRAWFTSAGRYYFPKGNPIPYDGRFAQFILTEASAALLNADGSQKQVQLFPPKCHGWLLPGQKLVVQSLNDHDGLVTLDSDEEDPAPVPFPRGTTAIVEIHSAPQSIPVFNRTTAT